MQSCRVVVNPSGLWSPGQRFESAQDYKNIFNISFLQSLKKYHIILNCFRANKRQMPSILAVNIKFYFDPLPEVTSVRICNPIAFCQGSCRVRWLRSRRTQVHAQITGYLYQLFLRNWILDFYILNHIPGCTIQIRELGSLKAVQWNRMISWFYI